jgi:hypothetical protein
MRRRARCDKYARADNRPYSEARELDGSKNAAEAVLTVDLLEKNVQRLSRK